MNRLLVLAVAATLSAGCSEKSSGKLTREKLMDPETCADCHPNHYREWSGSMHAYAADDPVFLAMNARGQRETDGALGDFCINCHAPLAVSEGLTTDGQNLDEIPSHLKGITCYFCHSVDSVDGTHNNPLVLADDLVLRGGIRDPTPNGAHEAKYSPLHDRNDLRSADLCGSCHDIVTPAGVHLERTYAEWQETLFSKAESGEPQTCGNCHMRGRDDVAADFDGVPLRRVHSHEWPGVDIALTPFPEADRQKELVQAALDPTVLPKLCVYPAMGRILVDLENIAAGHSFPSGAAQDRRVWVTLTGYLQGEVVFESGKVPDGVPASEVASEDASMWLLGDRLLDSEGNPTHAFWKAATIESELLPGPTARSPAEPGYVDPHVQREYSGVPPVDRVTMSVSIRPIGLDVLHELVASNDLDASYLEAMPTFELAASRIEWREADAVECVPSIR